MKEKSVQADKEVQEGSALKTAGADREITAGLFINFTHNIYLIITENSSSWFYCF